jgi:hypothetical protein
MRGSSIFQRGNVKRDGRHSEQIITLYDAQVSALVGIAQGIMREWSPLWVRRGS